MLPDHRCIILPKVSIPRRMRSLSGSCDTPSALARKSRPARHRSRSGEAGGANSMWTPLERLLERGFSVHRSGFLVAGTLRFYMFSTLNLERRTQEPRKSTYRPTNSKMFTNRPDESRKSGTAVRRTTLRLSTGGFNNYSFDLEAIRLRAFRSRAQGRGAHGRGAHGRGALDRLKKYEERKVTNPDFIGKP